MKKLMMVLAAALLALGVSAETEIVDGVTWYYETFSDGGKTGARIIAGADKYAGDLTIPSELGGYPVTSVGAWAFSFCNELNAVVFPESVRSIGNGAFYDCGGLTMVNVTTAVTSIGSEAFRGCSSLTSLTIPSGVTSIGDAVFFGCKGLTTVMIPKSVKNIGSGSFYGCSRLSAVTIPEGVVSVGDNAFYKCTGLMSVVISEGVANIGYEAFYGCQELISVTIPSSVETLGVEAFSQCGLRSVEFWGAPPTGVSSSGLLDSGVRVYLRKREYGAAWLKIIDHAQFGGYIQSNWPNVEIVSASIREDDPTVMDVVYKVKSARPTVKVRALAFQDGERSFAKVVRPAEFIEDTAKNIGDTIRANEEHKISWRVSADWKVDLAKVKFEVLAVEDDLLPLELTTIPKIGDHAAMEISWNAMTEQQVLDAMFWMYADKDDRLTVTDGKVYYDGNLAVDGTTLFANAIECVYSRMGFGTLSGDELKYANEMTRLGLSPSGVRQYAWREVND